MRIYGMSVIVNLPQPIARAMPNPSMVGEVSIDREEAEWYEKWNGKKGEVMTYRGNSDGTYLFLVRFGTKMETFDHRELLLDAAEIEAYEAEQERADEYRKANGY